MKKSISIIIVLVAMLLTSCATVKPTYNPNSKNMSQYHNDLQKYYTDLQKHNNKK